MKAVELYMKTPNLNEVKLEIARLLLEGILEIRAEEKKKSSKDSSDRQTNSE